MDRPRARLPLWIFWNQDPPKGLPEPWRDAPVPLHASGHRCSRDRRRPRPGDLRPHVPEVLHARHADSLQCRNTAPPDVELLPSSHEGRQHRGHLRHPQGVRPNLQVVRGHRYPLLEHPCERHDDQGDKRGRRRHRAHAARLQQHGPVRQPGRWEAQGFLRHLLGALARRHHGVSGASPEPGRR